MNFPGIAAKKSDSMANCRSLLAFAALILLTTACRKAEVTSYRVPKEKDSETATVAAGDTAGAPTTPPGMAGTPVATAQGSGLEWTAPADWKAKPASAMRKGSYTIPGDGATEADFSITAFPGDVGGELANVNRWRGQVQLPPLAEADGASAVTRIEHGGVQFAVVNFAATDPAGAQRILGAIVPFAGSTWFFKITGPGTVVEKARPAFLEFLNTVHASAGATTAAPIASASPAAPSPVTPLPGMAGTSVPTAAGPGLVWVAPANWRPKPGSAMRKGSFEVPGDTGEAGDLSITAFPGDVGGELANVNRWRNQVQLPPVAESELGAAVTRVTQNNLAFAIVDFTAPGTNSPGILGAIVPFAGATWFIKLTGPAALLAKAKPSFLEFLKTVRAP